MAGIQVDPKEILKGEEFLLGKDGGLCSLDGVPGMVSLMEASTEMVNRSMYLEILLHTNCRNIFNRFIRVGGYRLLNSWLTYSKATNNTSLLQLVLLTLQKLPLKVVHLKQNNTAKLVKQLSKSAETEELRELASMLVASWMETIRSQSASSSANSPTDKRKKKENDKVQDQDVQNESGDEEKNKDQAISDLSNHAKIRTLEIETLIGTSNKLENKHIKPPVLKRSSSGPCDAAPLKKNFRPHTLSSDSATEIIPAHPDKPNSLSEPRGQEHLNQKSKKKKKKSVHWAQEEQLKQYFYFDLDETERVNVNKIKDFFKTREHELTLMRACRLSHDTTEEWVHWTPVRSLTLPGGLVTPGANSTEELTQQEREMGILQESFLSKESVPILSLMSPCDPTSSLWMRVTGEQEPLPADVE
ncbi:serine/threonine-protein phosphatase 1 regulatory subunit 10-like isoform X1 [Phycodurus eques]|uniref:serine/threonine-protein phosphatase 1 regulatory subunit 10-like isoform X1 n=1 Tax=Phycodurus eques TaxID=693459 RepID=UPI002ACE7996|nr:serine/threonine-protein phosphatase 1 regulatory subunit 10-like isoform X1 [Phycodurus eques]